MTRRRMLVALAGTCLVAAVGAVWQSSRIATVTAVYREDGLLGVQARVRESLDLPNVPWEVASPDDVALSSQALESLRASLAAQDTDSLIVARQGRIALEWYGPDHGPNRREPLAAAVKGITASVLLMAALTDGLVGLDDRVAQYVPEWGQVTLRHLASYSSSRVSGTATTCSTTASSSME
jgi:CubicO group peptidase (beta-lactamase class C family)